MGRRALGWTLVLTVLGSWCLAALAVVAGLAPAQAPDSRPLPASADAPVVLVGIPGLTWDLVDESTPTLHRLAQQGGSAALVLRGPDEVTCSADAWLTVGTGSRTDREALGCGTEAPPPWGPEGTQQPDLAALSGPAQAAGTCVATHGLAAEPDAAGTPQLDTATTGLLARPTLDPSCRLQLVAAPPVLEGDRSETLADVDAALADLLEQVGRVEGTVVVSGMGQTAFDARAQALVVTTPGSPDDDPTLLTSGSTRQAGLVQLVDLTPTLLQLADVPTGSGDLPGDPVAAVAPSPAAPSAAAADLADAVSDAKRLAPWALGALAVIVLPLLALGAALRRWAPGHPPGLLTAASLVLMSLPAGTFLAGLVPWWRAGQPWPALVALSLGAAILVACLAWWLPGARRSALGPPAVVAALTLVVLGVDTIWSSRLGLVSVLGLQPVTAGRFYGQGNVGYGILLGALLVLMAAVLTWLPHRGSALAVGLLGVGALVLGAAPQAGADFGSVPATAVTTGLVLLAALEVRWRIRSLLLVGVGAALLAALAMVLDWLRGPERRTHLGAFVQSVIDGEAWGIVTRKLQQSVGIVLDYPLSWLAVVALVALAVLVVRRPSWSDPLWTHAGVAPVTAAAVVGMTVAWVLNDSGIAAVALCLTVLLPAGVAVLALSPGAAGGGATPRAHGPAAGGRAAAPGR
ncbi:hypothetical protein SGUI_1676 [Serinicoccus hydrothermalis]|uniref:Uncharacterized protein n=1 Tax=Serinicoccus hydrothermalis TaxID=1758689 RepID=A0A1B1NCB8_9MICO|nr:hypothetical protein [Serinicoccus hydrothermalis]ANS79072.1 hypothetical protein SGUI_1676 [Serinicoccus hydrothermalis]